MLNETNIKCFLSLSETLNFTKTAKELYMSQQAVSQHISRLEEDLGFPLFVRSRHFVALTQAGKSCRDFFAEMSERCQALIADTRAQYAALSSSINVGHQNWIDLGPAIGTVLREMKEEMPDLEIRSARYNPGALVSRLMSGELHLIVMYGRWAPHSERMELLRLTKAPMVLMVSPENPLAVEGATYEAFLKEPFIIDSFEQESAAETSRRVRQEIHSFGLSPSEVIVVPDRDSAYTAAEMGQGIVLTTSMNRIINSSHLKAYPMRYEESLVCVWHSDEENAMVARYAQHLARAYAKRSKET